MSCCHCKLLFIRFGHGCLGPACLKIASCIKETIVVFLCYTDKKISGKTKEEQINEKKNELERRLQAVTGQLNSEKKTAKKGKHFVLYDSSIMIAFFSRI